MKNQMLFFEPILEKADNYSQTTLQLLKLKATSKIAEVASLFILRTFIYIPLAIGFVMLSIAASLYIGELAGSAAKGFLITAGIYMFPALLIYFFRNKFLKRKLQNAIIQELLKKQKDA